MKKTIIAALSLILSGCAQGISPDTTFNTNSEDGLIAIGVDSFRYLTLLTFSRMDPETCQLTAFAGVGNRGMDGKGTGKHFYINTMPPGVWVLSSATYADVNMRIVNKFDKGGIAFEVKPGEFIHIGELNLAPFGPEIKSPDPEGLTAYLEGYPNVTASPTTVRPWLTPFSSNKNEAIANCRPRPL